MSDEQWRVIHEFPGYMISPYGEIRNYHTGKLIVPRRDNGRESVRLFKNGRSHTRSVQKLINITYPREDPHTILDDSLSKWTEIPGFEQYEISKFGLVRRKSTQRLLKIGTDSGDFVQLSRNGQTVRRAISGLMRLVGYDL